MQPNSTITLFIGTIFLGIISLISIHQTSVINNRIGKLEIDSLNRIDQIEENIINNCNVYHGDN
jgi:hypothetical protein